MHELAPRNATEDAILAAGRAALAEQDYERLTIDGLARRAFVSRTTVYFYFRNKRAVIDRLIQQAFAEMYAAAAPYFEGDGNPRAELRLGMARIVAATAAHENELLLAARLAGAVNRIPSQWQPYVTRFVHAATRRIARDQERGLAPADIPAQVAAGALCAMVERALTVEVMRRDGSAERIAAMLAELWWRAAYARPG